MEKEELPKSIWKSVHIYAIETFDRDTAFVKSNSLFWEDIASAFNMTEIVSAPKNIGYRQIVPWFSFTKPENGNILYMGTTNSEGCTHLNREIKIEFNNPVPVSLLEQWRSTPLEKFIDRKAALAFVNDVFISERNNLPEDGMAKSFRIAMSYNLADKEEIKDLIGYLLEAIGHAKVKAAAIN